MGLFWQIVSLLSVWLVYGVIASFFVKNSNKRDYLLILLSGFLGGLVGGLLANEVQIPDNIWYLSEFLKLVFAVFSMHGQNIGLILIERVI